ncbi:MAG: amidohydrolase family protein, partial [Actinobacteria bacterium]|nr:amidohydrolase family protein [Actinomycetota bacterium]
MLMSDDVIPQTTLDKMVRADMTIVPTLSVFSHHGLRTAIANLKKLLAAGGRVVYGTDLGNEGPRPGIDPTEVARMSSAGMSGGDIIRSATVEATEWLGLPGVGAIVEGNDADLVLLAGDPLSDLDAFTRVIAVWRRGVLKEP